MGALNAAILWFFGMARGDAVIGGPVSLADFPVFPVFGATVSRRVRPVKRIIAIDRRRLQHRKLAA